MNIQIRKQETYEKATQQRLQHDILWCISSMISNLAPHAETLSQWQDELYDMASVTDVAENQYRVYTRNGEPYDRIIVEVVEIDQDDDEQTQVDAVSDKEYAAWLWSNCSEEEQAEYLKSYQAHLALINDTTCPTQFDWDSEDDREYLFKLEYKHPSDTSDLVDYLQENREWWNKKYDTLLDKDETPETEEREVFEHWMVSAYAAEQLQSVGEKVVEFMGIYVWCRTCTGQSIWMDGWSHRLGEQYCKE